ncbi:MAG: type II secretion system protein [Patescibacteria group bacterium]
MVIPFRRSLKEGFTLVELLVVIGIIAILATILLLQLGTARSKSRDTARIAHINQMRSAAEQYFDDNGTYPKFTDFGTAANNFSPKYISPVPVDPLGAATCTTYGGAGCYGYAWNIIVGTNATRYQVWAELELKNKQALDTDSDINVGVDWTASGGTGVNGASANETCPDTNVANTNCVFDLGLK